MGRMEDKPIMESEQIFPVVPLRDVVIFPSMATAILVGRQPSVNAVERAIETDKILLVITQKNPTDNDPGFEDLYRIGTIVRIGLFFRLPDGTIKLMLEGVSRVRVRDFKQMENYLAATVVPIEEEDAMTREVEALTRKVEALFTDYVRMNHRVPNEVLLSLQAIDDRSQVADTVAAHMMIRNDVKQRILETVSLEERFMMLSRILSEELEILRVEKDIDEKVSNQVQKSQKELFLHEKMKVIRDELGHGDEMGIYHELKRKIRKSGMPRGAQKVAFEDLERLRMMSPMTPEATVVETISIRLSRSHGTRERRTSRHRRREEKTGRGPLRADEGEGTHSRVPLRRQAREQSQGPDSLFGRASRGGKDVARQIDSGRDRKAFRAGFTRRHERRGGDKGTQEDLHRFHARKDNPGRKERGDEEPRLSSRRDRQTQFRFQGRPLGRPFLRCLIRSRTRGSATIISRWNST